MIRFSFFYCGKKHTAWHLPFYPFLNAQFSDIKYIHMLCNQSPGFFASRKIKTIPINPNSSFSLSPNPWQPTVQRFALMTVNTLGPSHQWKRTVFVLL